MYRSDKQFMKNPATAAMRIYIGNLAESVVPDNLEERFKQHGNILGMHAQRGFAFIQYETDAQARLAIEREHGSQFHHRKINVKHANVDKRPAGSVGPPDLRNPRPLFDQSPMHRMNEAPPPLLGGGSGDSGDFVASGDSSVGHRGSNLDQSGPGSGGPIGRPINDSGPGSIGSGSNQQQGRDQGNMASGPIHQQGRLDRDLGSMGGGPNQQQSRDQGGMGRGPNQQSGRDQGGMSGIGGGPNQHPEREQGNSAGGLNQHQGRDQGGMSGIGGGPNQHQGRDQGNSGGGPNQHQGRDQGGMSGIGGGPNQHQGRDQGNIGGGPIQHQGRDQGGMSGIGGGPNQHQGRDQGNIGGGPNQHQGRDQGGGPNQQGRDQGWMDRDQGGMGGGPNQHQGRDQGSMGGGGANQQQGRDQGGMGGGPNQQQGRDQGWMDRDQGGMGGGTNQHQGRDQGGMGGGPIRSGGTGPDRGNQRDRDRDDIYDNRNKFGDGGRNRGRGAARGNPYNSRDRGSGRENYGRDRDDNFDNFGLRSGTNKPDNNQPRGPLLSSPVGPVGSRGPMGGPPGLGGPRGPGMGESMTGGQNMGSIDVPMVSGPGFGTVMAAKLLVPPERPDRNDCEIIVVSKQLTIYAEYIEQRLKALGLVVDLLYPNEDVPIGRVLANISSRGCLFAILVMPQNEENRSLTLNILHGIPQEHRNMPIEDSLILITRNFDAYMRGEVVPTTDDEDTKKLTDRHPDQIQTIFNLLAENRQLSSGQYDRVIKYLQERKELQMQFELTEGIESDLVEPEVKNKRAELQSRIMNILNKTDELTSTSLKSELAMPSATITPFSGTASTGATPLLNDPTVQKALDSIIMGDMFKGLTGAM